MHENAKRGTRYRITSANRFGVRSLGVLNRSTCVESTEGCVERDYSGDTLVRYYLLGRGCLSGSPLFSLGSFSLSFGSFSFSWTERIRSTVKYSRKFLALRDSNLILSKKEIPNYRRVWASGYPGFEILNLFRESSLSYITLASLVTDGARGGWRFGDRRSVTVGPRL